MKKTKITLLLLVLISIFIAAQIGADAASDDTGRKSAKGQIQGVCWSMKPVSRLRAVRFVCSLLNVPERLRDGMMSMI